jgi:hypothetical protein
MGQAKDESLAQLLLLGESEAVVAAVHAAGLTDELAARAWWAMPTAENARRMLEKQAVVDGETGKVLAEFLIEFLPFEEDQSDMIESVKLVLQPGLISQEDKEKLWAKTKTKRSFYVGFLHAMPDDLPVNVDAHSEYGAVKEKLTPLINDGNEYAVLLEKILSEKGQAFIQTIEDALKKPGNQDVIVLLLGAISKYFTTILPEEFTDDDIEAICNEAESYCCADNNELNKVITALDGAAIDAQKHLCAMTVLSCLSVKLVNPIFARTDAIGTVMRKKIKPVTDPIIEQLHILHN